MTHDPEAFIRSYTALSTPSLVPEIKLYLATELVPLWRATAEVLEQFKLQPPYWAFAWPGGQAMARLILDQPEIVRGKRILDFAAGSGLAGLAAARAGASHVRGADIDPLAATAMHLNAEANALPLDILVEDLTASSLADVDVIMAGDVCYERPMAERVLGWLRQHAAAGAIVLLGDPGRTYAPRDGLVEISRYNVPTSRELEDATERETVVWRLL